MTYSLIADVRNALSPDGSQDPSTAASLSDAQLQDAIAEADGVIDAYVGSRYQIVQDATVPGAATSPVRWWSRSIAAYYAQLTWSRNQDVPEEDPVRQRYESVMTLLKAVNDGSIQLPLVPLGGVDTSDVFVYNLYDGNLFEPSMFGLDRVGCGGSWQVAKYVKTKP